MKNKNLMITPEQLFGFIKWQQEKPGRKIEIRIENSIGYPRIKLDDGTEAYRDYRVTAIEEAEVQFVYDPSEIKSVAEIRRIQLEKEIQRLSDLVAKDEMIKETTA